LGEINLSSQFWQHNPLSPTPKERETRIVSPGNREKGDVNLQGKERKIKIETKKEEGKKEERSIWVSTAAGDHSPSR